MKPLPPTRSAWRARARYVGGFFVWSGIVMTAGAVLKILLRS